MTLRYPLFGAIIAIATFFTSSRLASQAPPMPHVERGACPGECCSFGNWQAQDTLRVYAVERDTTSHSFLLPPSAPFIAVTGDLHILQAGIVVVTRRAHQGEDHAGGTWGRELSPGDTVYILGYRGEGNYNAWYRGDTIEVNGLWNDGMELPSGVDYGGRLQRPVISEWWVNIQTSNGQRGWLLMEHSKVQTPPSCS